MRSVANFNGEAVGESKELRNRVAKTAGARLDSGRIIRSKILLNLFDVEEHHRTVNHEIKKTRKRKYDERSRNADSI